MTYYLGIDGGGTRTTACIVDESGIELGRGSGGPCNIISFPDDTLRSSISDATANALVTAGLPADTTFAAACAGVAGFTSKKRRAAFQAIFTESIPAATHQVQPDFTIAWWGATGGEPGIVCIAGTGAVVYGRNAAGESSRADGRGFLLGDRGSGFDLGRMALIEAMRDLESGAAMRPITISVMSHADARDADDLVQWTHVNFEPARIAGLAEVIGECASEGDQDAITLIQQCGTRLRQSVETVFESLRLPSDAPVYPLGGLWKLGKTLRESFGIAGLNVKDPKHDSAYGAALLAMRSCK